MQRSNAIVTMSWLLVIGGCAAHSSKPVIDPAGVDMVKYEKDVGECEQIALQVEQKAGAGAAEGAVVGGLIGGIFGGSDGALKGAGAGAVGGAAGGSRDTQREKSRVVKNCLRDRGYRILNWPRASCNARAGGHHWTAWRIPEFPDCRQVSGIKLRQLLQMPAMRATVFSI